MPHFPQSQQVQDPFRCEGIAHPTLNVLPGAETNLPFLVPKEFATKDPEVYPDLEIAALQQGCTGT